MSETVENDFGLMDGRLEIRRTRYTLLRAGLKAKRIRPRVRPGNRVRTTGDGRDERGGRLYGVGSEREKAISNEKYLDRARSAVACARRSRRDAAGRASAVTARPRARQHARPPARPPMPRPGVVDAPGDRPSFRSFNRSVLLCFFAGVVCYTTRQAGNAARTNDVPSPDRTFLERRRRPLFSRKKSYRDAAPGTPRGLSRRDRESSRPACVWSPSSRERVAATTATCAHRFSAVRRR